MCGQVYRLGQLGERVPPPVPPVGIVDEGAGVAVDVTSKAEIGPVMLVIGGLDGRQIAVRLALAYLRLALNRVFQQPEGLVPMGIGLVVDHHVRLDVVQGVGMNSWRTVMIDHQPMTVIEMRPDAFDLHGAIAR